MFWCTLQTISCPVSVSMWQLYDLLRVLNETGVIHVCLSWWHEENEGGNVKEMGFVQVLGKGHFEASFDAKT
jgi:hypothetical protein